MGPAPEDIDVNSICFFAWFLGTRKILLKCMLKLFLIVLSHSALVNLCARSTTTKKRLLGTSYMCLDSGPINSGKHFLHANQTSDSQVLLLDDCILCNPALLASVIPEL